MQTDSSSSQVRLYGEQEYIPMIEFYFCYPDYVESFKFFIFRLLGCSCKSLANYYIH